MALRWCGVALGWLVALLWATRTAGGCTGCRGCRICLSKAQAPLRGT